MGVQISAITVGKYICGENDKAVIERFEDENPEVDTVCLYTLDFAPIEHLPMYERGWYEFLSEEETEVSMPYSAYARFRKAICDVIHGDWEQLCQKIIDGTVPTDSDFAEMLYFADNEGCFDYSIAEKLLHDFTKHRDTILPTLADWMMEEYDNYIQVLQECVNCKGVVRYH